MHIIKAKTASITNPPQMIITLEDNALVANIKLALKLIRGIASVRVANIGGYNTITPAMCRSINKSCPTFDGRTAEAVGGAADGISSDRDGVIPNHLIS